MLLFITMIILKRTTQEMGYDSERGDYSFDTCTALHTAPACLKLPPGQALTSWGGTAARAPQAPRHVALRDPPAVINRVPLPYVTNKSWSRKGYMM